MGQQTSTHSLQQPIDEDDEQYTQSNHQPNLMVKSNQYNFKERKILVNKRKMKNAYIDLNLNDEWINKIKNIKEQIQFDDLTVIILYLMNVLMLNILMMNIILMNNFRISRCSIIRMLY